MTWITLISGCLLAPTLAWAAAAAGALTVVEPGGAAEFSLFVGVEFRLQHGDRFYPVAGVRGSSFVIQVEGEDVLIPMRRAHVPIQIAQTTRLTPASAVITGLSHERGYSPGNDPQQRWFAAQVAVTDNAQRIVDNATSTLRARESAAAQRQAAIDRGGPAAAAAAASPAPDVHGAYQNLASAALTAESELGNPGLYAGRAQAELAEGNYDALEASFELAPAVPLRNAYFVVLLQFRERDAKPGVSRNWIHARHLGAVAVGPQRVRIWQNGFPLGFEVEKLQVHIYDEGREVATNHSEKRMALSVDEAFDYMLLEYLAANRGATLPATLAIGGGALKRSVRLADLRLAEPVFVRVSSEGRPLAAFADDAATRPLASTEILAVVETLRFRPALEAGEPVEGLVRLRLGDFLQ